MADQLVDFEARLRNLRKTETTLLQIMERSGSITDVLKVSEAFSQTRQEAEQLTAQLANLKNRVAYSSEKIRKPHESIPFTRRLILALGSRLPH